MAHGSGEEPRSGGGVGIMSMVERQGRLMVVDDYLQTRGQVRWCIGANMRCGAAEEQFGWCLQTFMGKARMKGVFDYLATRDCHKTTRD